MKSDITWFYRTTFLLFSTIRLWRLEGERFESCWWIYIWNTFLLTIKTNFSLYMSFYTSKHFNFYFMNIISTFYFDSWDLEYFSSSALSSSTVNFISEGASIVYITIPIHNFSNSFYSSLHTFPSYTLYFSMLIIFFF